MSLHIYSLYSGSSGNAFLIANGEECLLIDGGKNCKRLCSCITACGHSPEQIKAVLVTHEHSDHISALPVFLKRNHIRAHAVLETAQAMRQAGVAPEWIVSHPLRYRETIGGFSVASFATPHDSLASVGYRIEVQTGDGICNIGYATDMGCLTEETEEYLTGCDYVILESNHDLDMLWNGEYPYFLKKRIGGKNGHLSNADCASLAGRLANSGTKGILLAHLSRENNTPDLARATTAASLAGTGTTLLVAAPEEITVLL